MTCRSANHATRQSPFKQQLSPKELIVVFAATASHQNMSMALAFPNTTPSVRPFDLDSFPLLINNCCTACITTDPKDFIDSPTQVAMQVQGVGGLDDGHKEGED